MPGDERICRPLSPGGGNLVVLTRGSAVLAFLDGISSLFVVAARESSVVKLLWYNDYSHLWQGSLLRQTAKLVAGRAQEVSASAAGLLQRCLAGSFLFRRSLSVWAAGGKPGSFVSSLVGHSRVCALVLWLFTLDEQEG